MNTDSIIFYQLLITDCQNEIKYWTAQPDSVEKGTMLLTFNARLNEHQANMDRLLSEITDAPAAIDEVQSWIDLIGSWIAKFGKFIPDDVKKWFTLLLNAAHFILDVLKKV